MGNDECLYMIFIFHNLYYINFGIEQLIVLETFELAIWNFGGRGGATHQHTYLTRKMLEE